MRLLFDLRQRLAHCAPAAGGRRPGRARRSARCWTWRRCPSAIPLFAELDDAVAGGRDRRLIAAALRAIAHTMAAAWSGTGTRRSAGGVAARARPRAGHARRAGRRGRRRASRGSRSSRAAPASARAGCCWPRASARPRPASARCRRAAPSSSATSPSAPCASCSSRCAPIPELWERALGGRGRRRALGVRGAGAVDGDDARRDASFGALHGLYWLTANLAADAPLALADRRPALGRPAVAALPGLPGAAARGPAGAGGRRRPDRASPAPTRRCWPT